MLTDPASREAKNHRSNQQLVFLSFFFFFSFSFPAAKFTPDSVPPPLTTAVAEALSYVPHLHTDLTIFKSSD